MNIVLNFFGGPGAGKSTAMFAAASHLKKLGYEVEIAPEFAKELIWAKSEYLLNNQPYIFGEQYKRLWILKDQVQVTVCDSPLLFSYIYEQNKTEGFKELVFSRFNEFNNLNIFVKRVPGTYIQKGRVHDEDDAKEKDQEILKMLNDNNIPVLIVEDSFRGIPAIINNVGKILNMEDPFVNRKEK